MVLQNISKKYKEEIIFENISFDIHKGEIVCILGSSGIGKTSLLNIAIGTVEKTLGNINRFDTKISYVFQDDRLIPWLNLFENIKLVSKNTKDDEILNLIEYMGLSDYITFFPKELSGGMKKRASIARALIFGGDLVILDEPFKSLDIKLRKEMLDLLLSLRNEKKISFLMVTHDIEEALYIADKIIILKGKPAHIHKIYDENNMHLLKDIY